jgi:hypothetical protein
MPDPLTGFSSLLSVVAIGVIEGIAIAATRLGRPGRRPAATLAELSTKRREHLELCYADRIHADLLDGQMLRRRAPWSISWPGRRSHLGNRPRLERASWTT